MRCPVVVTNRISFATPGPARPASCCGCARTALRGMDGLRACAPASENGGSWPDGSRAPCVKYVCVAGPLIRVTDVIELVVARRGVFVVHRGGRTVVADPMTPVVLRDEYRVSHPRGGGDRCPESGSEHFSLRLVWSWPGDG